MSVLLICIDARTHFFCFSDPYFPFREKLCPQGRHFPFHHTHTTPKRNTPFPSFCAHTLSLFAQPLYPHACTSVVPVLHPYFCSMFPLLTLHLSHTYSHSHTPTHTRHTYLFSIPKQKTSSEKEPECGVCEKKRDKKRVIISPIDYIDYRG